VSTRPGNGSLLRAGGEHFWARVFSTFGHTVRLMAPPFVKPYLKNGAHRVASDSPQRVVFFADRGNRQTARHSRCPRFVVTPITASKSSVSVKADPPQKELFG